MGDRPVTSNRAALLNHVSLKINVHDHLVVSAKETISMKAKGLI